jgi:endonuclease/exonuclease/phosphatase (EEP) superfamily protein YafD
LAEAHPPRSAVLIARTAAVLLAVSLAAIAVVVVAVYTPLQEVSFRWMALAGVALPLVALGAGLVTASAAVWSTAQRRVRRDDPSARAPRRLGPVLLVAVAWVPVLVLSWPTLAGMVAPQDPGQGQPFTLVSQNIWYQHDDPARIAEELLALDADVMVLVEYTPEHRSAMRAAGIDRAYPHRWEEPGELGGGLAVFSVFPLEDPRRLDTWSGAVEVGLVLDEGTIDLVAVHPVAPSDYWGLRRWKGDYTTLIDTLSDAGPDTIITGDFNATGAHQRFRELTAAAGVRDAQDLSGSGFGPTWPGVGWRPPIMRLDHVLVGDGIGVESVEVLDDVGSDHRGLEARLRFPRS